ncbi:MAG: restriction endonuclease [Lysobacterales bacterium]|nr:restriction endonuclease [Xanthomonadales bacterium]
MRSKPGLTNVILAVTSRLPWWLGVLLAVAAWFGFGLLSNIEVPLAAKAADAGPMVIRQGIRVAASILQYAVPALCLLGALMSVLLGRRRKALGAQVRSGARGVDQLDWREFERLVGHYFEQRGFAVVETGGSADGGVDLKLSKDGERYLVQCKHWRARSVGVEPVRELYGVLAASRGVGAYMVTSGRYTRAARTFAQGREIQLLDGDDLRKALLEAGPTRDGSDQRKPQNAAASDPRPEIAPSITSSTPTGAIDTAPKATTPPCPRCAAPMVQRVVRSGDRAGQRFWGCSKFPTCRGAKAMDTE